MRKNVLIIGGTGFIGYHLAKSCLSLKWNVTSISLNKPKKYRKLKGVKYLIIDISNKKNFKKIDQITYDFVINLGGYVEHFNETQVKKYHFLAVKNLYEHFKNKKIKKFIQVGSSAEYGRSRVPQKENFICKPLGIYGKYKLRASKFLLKKSLKFKFPVTILRLYQVYGPNQDQNRFLPILIQACLKKKIFNSSSGIQKRDFLFISDAVKAFLKTLHSKKTNGHIINIGFGRSITLKKIMIYVGKKTKFFFPNYGKIKIRKDESIDIYPDIKKAKKMLNWKPSLNWNKGIIETIKHYKKVNAKL